MVLTYIVDVKLRSSLESIFNLLEEATEASRLSDGDGGVPRAALNDVVAVLQLVCELVEQDHVLFPFDKA